QGSVVVNLQTHTASATGGIMNIQHVLGSAVGGDRLTGDSQGNILIGHHKGNVLRAGTGRGVLIGGRRGNLIVGNSADDLEIAGKTAFDSSPDDLDAVFAAWNDNTKSYNQRISELRSGSGLAAGRKLVVGQTVFLEPSNGVVGPRFGFGGGNLYTT